MMKWSRRPDLRNPRAPRARVLLPSQIPSALQPRAGTGGLAGFSSNLMVFAHITVGPGTRGRAPLKGGGRLNASASRCYPRRHELSSYPLGSFFSRTLHCRPPSADNVATRARLDPAGQPRRTRGRCLGGLGCDSLAQLTFPGLAPRSLLVQLQRCWLESTDPACRGNAEDPSRRATNTSQGFGHQSLRQPRPPSVALAPAPLPQAVTPPAHPNGPS